MQPNTDEQIRSIWEKWHDYRNAQNFDGFLSIYAPAAKFESPAVAATMPDRADGIITGKEEIVAYFKGLARKPDAFFPKFYRTETYFTNGQELTWEYPRVTPTGEQSDVVEHMTIENGLISHHRVYWGWRGMQALFRANAKSVSESQTTENKGS